MNNAPHIKSPNYLSYAPTPDVTDLLAITPNVIAILLNINCFE